MDQLDADREQFLDLIRHWHKGHPRSDQVPHCVNVARWLERALDMEPQPVAGRREMILAALGHDLYEDSAIRPADVAAKYGREVDRLIEGVTERAGVTEFVGRVASGPEGARLIKLCDGIDNYGGLVENGLLRADPAKWVEIVRRQMEPMFSRIESVPFHEYPVAGKWLCQELLKRRGEFWAVVSALLQVVKPKSGPGPAKAP
jgi:hypothetical protein